MNKYDAILRLAKEKDIPEEYVQDALLERLRSYLGRKHPLDAERARMQIINAWQNALNDMWRDLNNAKA